MLSRWTELAGFGSVLVRRAHETARPEGPDSSPKSELLERIATKNSHRYQPDVETIVNTILGTIATALTRDAAWSCATSGCLPVLDKQLSWPGRIAVSSAWTSDAQRLTIPGTPHSGQAAAVTKRPHTIPREG